MKKERVAVKWLITGKGKENGGNKPGQIPVIIRSFAPSMQEFGRGYLINNMETDPKIFLNNGDENVLSRFK